MAFRDDVEADFKEILDEIGVLLLFDDDKAVKGTVSPVGFEKDLQAGGFIDTARYEATVRETDLVDRGIILQVGKTCKMRGKKFRIERVEVCFHAGLDRFYLTEK